MFMKTETWTDFFSEQAEKLYFRNLLSFIENEYASKTVFPSKMDLFKAFELTPLEAVKVVIIGQDPYHQPGQAMGLAFSVPIGIKPPPSLMNIYKEISQDLGVEMNFQNGDLTYLAEQGVLLFNPIFTVEQGRPLSHNNKGYQLLTQAILTHLSRQQRPLVFVLWGTKAQRYEKHIIGKHHLIIKATHPSPLGANKGGFFGLHQFSSINHFLIRQGHSPIRWQNK